MRDSIYLIAAGQTPVVKQTDLSVAELGAAAVKDCLSDDELPTPTAIYSGNMLSGILSEQQQLSAMIAYAAGLKGIEALTIEAACGSGGSAMHIAMMSVASGMHDCVIAMGVEKMGHAPREKTTRGLATASNWRTEGGRGETFVSLNGRLMQAYMDRYEVTAENFAPFSLVAHANACKNPYALFHKDVDIEKYMNSKLIDGPVRLYDASPICDGSAAVLVANEETAMKAKENGFPIVRIRASSVATDAVGLDDRNELLTPAGVIQSSNRAYEQAGLGPEDIDIFELHDAYTIMSILSLEGAGFAKPGEGWRFGAEKKIEPTGDLPIAVAGGLKARGHPVGATGVYQLVENFLQLTDQAGDCQLEDKNIAMTQNVGGTAATIATHILERVS